MAQDDRTGPSAPPTSGVPSQPISSETTTSKRFGKQVGSWMDDMITQGRSDAAEVSVDVAVDEEAPPSWTWKPLVPGAPPPPPTVIEPFVEEPPPAARRPFLIAAAATLVLALVASAWLFLH